MRPRSFWYLIFDLYVFILMGLSATLMIVFIRFVLAKLGIVSIH